MFFHYQFQNFINRFFNRLKQIKNFNKNDDISGTCRKTILQSWARVIFSASLWKSCPPPFNLSGGGGWEDVMGCFPCLSSYFYRGVSHSGLTPKVILVSLATREVLISNDEVMRKKLGVPMVIPSCPWCCVCRGCPPGTPPGGHGSFWGLRGHETSVATCQARGEPAFFRRAGAGIWKRLRI